MDIYFNRPALTGNEKTYINRALKGGRMAGDGPFTKQCSELLSKITQTPATLLTHSCTAALEISAILGNFEPGDEIIVPSYTFVSTANAFALLGAKIVFVDVCEDTLNINPELIEAAITERTRAVVPVHYAGVACDMDSILRIAKQHDLLVIEDAAQGIMSFHKDKMLGSIGDLGTFSFHETKNIISGEGGALIVNNSKYVERAEIVREKGTNRSQFFRGEVDKYTWQDIGSSYLPGELIAAFLLAQLERAEQITSDRIASWNTYDEMTVAMEDKGLLRRPIVPDYCQHNGHMYYVLLNEEVNRDSVLQHMKSMGVQATFHYVPLHSSPCGEKQGRTFGSLEVTNNLSARLVRLPLYFGLTQSDQEQVIQALEKSIEMSR